MVAHYKKRVQTVLTDEQFAALNQRSSDEGKPVSVLIREAVEKVYFEPAALDRRRAALTRLLALNAPVSGWEQMEEEIISADRHFDQVDGIVRLDPLESFRRATSTPK